MIDRNEGELAHWPPVGRAIRTGSFREQAEPTPDRIERAVADGRPAEAEALARHLVVEAQEIHDLYSAWCEELAALVGMPNDDADQHEEAWRRFVAASEAWRSGDALEPVLARWATAHDEHLERVADLLDHAVEEQGEEMLGEIWGSLQRDARAFYRATYGPARPWESSRERLIQVAIEGMHGHLGGPRRQGEVVVTEHPDRVSLTFATCGSGGRILTGGRHGVVEGSHGFAWSRAGVCRYCVHCCVLQQQGAIDDLGYPARVIDPPTSAGEPCTWTVYHDPTLVPPDAYTRVGRTPPT